MWQEVSPSWGGMVQGEVQLEGGHGGVVHLERSQWRGLGQALVPQTEEQGGPACPAGLVLRQRQAGPGYWWQ